MMLKFPLGIQKNYKDYAGTFLISILYLLIPVVFYLHGKITNYDVLPTSSADFVQYFSHMKSFGTAIIHNEFPQWNLYLASGTPEIVISGMYLPGIFLSILPLKIYMYIFFWIHMFFGGLGFYLYLKEKGLKNDVAVIAGIIFEISIQMNGARRGHCGIVAAISIFPIIMFFAKKYASTGKKKWLCLTAAMSALQTSAFLQYGFYAQIVLFAYMVNIVHNRKITLVNQGKLIVLYLAFYVGILSIYLFPILSVLREYSSFGFSSTEFTTFSSWSMHPIKIIMMIYPFIFKDVFQAFGNMNSSEMDIEIFFGTIVFILFVYSIILQKKRQPINIEIICMIIAFCLTCLAHIPVVRKIAFHIPVLNGFRCSGRALFIWNFFYLSLASDAMQIIADKSFSKNMNIRLAKKVSAAIFIITVIVCITTVSFVLGYSDTPRHAVFKDIKHVFIRAIIISVVFYLFLSTLEMDVKFLPEKLMNMFKRCALLLSILLLASIEILPFSISRHFSQVSELQQHSEISKILKEDFEYKVWDAFAGCDGGHNSIISQSKNINENIQAINAYIAFNNPNISKYFKNISSDISKIPFNFSGLQTGSFYASQLLKCNNDVLSMLGIKYLIDSSGLIKKSGGMSYVFSENQTKINLLEDANPFISEYFGDVGVYTVYDDIISDAVYEIEFDISADDNKILKFLSIDLYGGESYDFAENEVIFSIGKPEAQHYKTRIFSFDTSKANVKPVMRALAKSENNVPIKLQNVKLTLQPIAGSEVVYEYLQNDETGTEVYLNKNACPLIYSPDMVSSVDNWDELYNSSGEYRLDRIAYIKASDIHKNMDKVKVSDLKLSENSVTATLSAKFDSYICFSQCYSKYWKVKINGKKQKVDFVNGVIMGTFIPKGEVSIVFYYSNPFYFLGIFVFVLSMVSIIIIFVKNW